MGRSLGLRRDPGAVAPVATTRETLLSAVRRNHECGSWRDPWTMCSKSIQSQLRLLDQWKATLTDLAQVSIHGYDKRGCPFSKEFGHCYGCRFCVVFETIVGRGCELLRDTKNLFPNWFQ
jgi:hypothetical protein